MDGFLATLDQRSLARHLPAPRPHNQSPPRPPALSSFSQPLQHAAGVTRGHAPRQPWLADALGELGECVDEAREEGHPEPTQEGLAIAEALLKRVARLRAPLPRPNVYPTADHEIDLYFRRGDIGVSVLVVIDQDGGGACFSNVGGRHRTRHENVTRMFETIELELIGLSRIAGPN